MMISTNRLKSAFDKLGSIPPGMLKISFLGIFLLFQSSESIAQFEHSVINENARWTQLDYESSGHVPSEYFYKEYKLDGDTIVPNDTISKLYCKTHWELKWTFCGGLLEKNNQLIHFKDNLKKNHVIADFNLGIGDSLIFDTLYTDAWDTIKLFVTEIDSITLNDGSIRKRLKLDLYSHFPDWPFRKLEWIDGIGPTNGFLPWYMCYFYPKNEHEYDPTSLSCWSDLICYHNGDSTLYSAHEYPVVNCSYEGLTSNKPVPKLQSNLTISPNPVGDELYFSIDTTPNETSQISYEIFNQMGQRISSKKIVFPVEKSIDISAFNPGIYYLSVKSKDFVLMAPFLKMN